MKYPIIAYGHPVLREETRAVKQDEPNLKEIIQNMFETMYNAHGVGLAAPQVGLSLRIFVVDGSPMDGMLRDDPQPMKGFIRVIINPEIIEESGDKWAFEEGCLSIPDLRAEVKRPEIVKIRYYNEDFEVQEEELSGLKARIIQHEFDHLEGVLFTDYLSGFQKQLLKSKLARISKGKISPSYPMKFYQR